MSNSVALFPGQFIFGKTELFNFRFDYIADSDEKNVFYISVIIRGLF